MSAATTIKPKVKQLLRAAAGTSDRQLSAKRDELAAKRATFVAEHSSRLRDDAHRLLDEALAEMRMTAERALNDYSVGDLATKGIPLGFSPDRGAAMGYRSLLEIADLGATVGDDVAGWLHGLIDAKPGWSPLSRRDYEKQLAALDGQIQELDVVLEYRRAEQAKTETEQVAAAEFAETISRLGDEAA